MYNKSEIMKNAWSTYRNSFLCRIYKIETFADALKYAWASAKAAIAATKGTGWVKPSELTEYVARVEHPRRWRLNTHVARIEQ